MNENTIKEIDLRQSMTLSAPHPYALLVTKGGGRVNVMGVSWFSFASMKPGVMTFSISNRGYSHELLHMGAEAALCLPLEDIKEQAYACGTRSGRDTDKIATLGLDTAEVEGVPVIARSKVAWILKITGIVPAGDHLLHIGEIVKTVGTGAGKHLYAMNGYAGLDTL